jgi:hypothetical protein
MENGEPWINSRLFVNAVIKISQGKRILIFHLGKASQNFE